MNRSTAQGTRQGCLIVALVKCGNSLQVRHGPLLQCLREHLARVIEIIELTYLNWTRVTLHGVTNTIKHIFIPAAFVRAEVCIHVHPIAMFLAALQASDVPVAIEEKDD